MLAIATIDHRLFFCLFFIVDSPCFVEGKNDGHKKSPALLGAARLSRFTFLMGQGFAPTLVMVAFLRKKPNSISG